MGRFQDRIGGFNRYLRVGLIVLLGVALIGAVASARIAQSLTITAWRADRHPSNREYVLIHAEPLWRGLVRLRELPAGWVPGTG